VQSAISFPALGVLRLPWLSSRARAKVAAITGIDLLDLLAPAVRRGGGGPPPTFSVLVKWLFAAEGRRWSWGGDRRC